MAHFYLTLPSNSSANYYDNTLTKFTTRLQSSLSLSGDWEVGLSEIIFPHTWLTLDKHEAVFHVTCFGANAVQLPALNPDSVFGAIRISSQQDEATELYRVEVRIPHGYYETINELYREINKALSKIIPYGTHPPNSNNDNMMPRLKYNDTSRRVNFVMYRGQSLSFSPALATILGVAHRQNPSKPKDDEQWGWQASGVADITRGINYAMVYCDLLEHVPVGDTKAPLLRIVDATGSNGEIIHRSFDKARYVPLQRRHFDSVEIDIRDDIGNLIAFENGKLVVTLHFRQCKSPYFLG